VAQTILRWWLDLPFHLQPEAALLRGTSRGAKARRKAR
jgi:hypothetical protein